MKHFHVRRFLSCAALRSMLIGSTYKCTEQWMRLQRLRLEFRMKLASDEVWMIGQLHHLHVSAVGSRPRNPQSRCDHRFFVFSIEFVAMPVPLADFDLAVNLVGQRVRLDLARPGAQAHGAS